VESVNNFNNSDDKESEATQIYTLFLDRESPYEINTCSETLDLIKQKIDNQDIDSTLFEEVLKEIHWLLKDSFARFLESEEYRNFKINKSFKKDKIKREINVDRKSFANIFGRLTNSSPTRKSPQKKSKRRVDSPETTILVENYSL
jgi:C-terminal processing protease CtpA/Prc